MCHSIRFKTLLAFYLLVFAMAGVPPASAESATMPSARDPRGRWVTASGNLEVEIAPCATALCGTVVKVLANRSMSRDGEEMKAADTRDPMGMKVLIDFVPSEHEGAAPTKWKGQIYNRENGKTYSCIMTMGPGGELVLRGYVGIPWIGSTQEWKRAGVSLSGAR